MEVFTKYFRRLIVQNAPQIWHGARTDSSGSYSILVTEVQKVSTDPQQAAKIVDSIEFGDRDGDVFRDFDMSKFMDHFQLKTVGKVALASAFKRSSKPDQRAKADGILKNNIQPFLTLISDPKPTDAIDDIPPSVLASIIDHIAQHQPRDWTADNTHQLKAAIRQRYRSANLYVPVEISAALLLFDLLERNNSMVKIFQRHGPRATEKLERCRNILESVEAHDVGYQQVANVLLFMAIAGDEPFYNLSNFITALREHRGGQRIDWTDVIGSFDRDGVKVTRIQFKRLYDSLLPLAHEYENFDIQQLWGGDWKYAESQLSFVSAFLSFTVEELDATTIPKLRHAFTIQDFDDADDEIQAYAAGAVKSTFVSLDGTRALFNMVFRSSDTYHHAQQLGVVEHVINPRMDLFVASVSAIPKPWGTLQDQAVKQLIGPFFNKFARGWSFVFHILWKRDRQWLTGQLRQTWQANPANIIQIYDHATRHRWLDYLISLNNDMSLDLLTLAHARNAFDLEQWLDGLSQSMPIQAVSGALAKFLKTRAETDGSPTRGELGAPTLCIKTVHRLLTFLGEAGLAEQELIPLQRDCIHQYPRLINYGEGFDDIIDANGKSGLKLSDEADESMQEHYKLMYGNEVQVREILTDLEKYKNSRDPKEQELFTCMIYGLFDEYNCFSEYPMSALAITAVLFGGIINCNLLSRIALKAALAMVLEAVRDYQPDQPMFKFGLQALLHFKDRLSEWRLFTERLLQIRAIAGTEIEEVAQRILHDDSDLPNGDNSNGNQPDGIDGFLGNDSKVTEFSCLAVDASVRSDYEDPSEQAQGNITFALNNLSDRNLDSKFPELKSYLDDRNYQWLAHCLVDGLVKTQPNNQHLYMSLVDRLEDAGLWMEVLRQTFICSFRLLNSDKTLESSGDRTSLKNLADWLGSITLARNRPIKHRNISFKDLLIEAHDTERLALVIPFTCRTLTGAAQSAVFRPPNAWTMDIVRVLVEIRRYLDNKVKTQNIFEIEKLLSDLGISEKTVEASDAIRSRPPPDEAPLQALGADSVDGFGDLAITRIGRGGGRSERLSPALLPDLTEVAGMLKHSYTLPASNSQMRTRIQSVLSQAVIKAIQDIIEPVVERSVTIAAISASQLISKDFALEPDGERYENSAHTAVRCLAGNLALVTSKEPLRVSMANNVRSFSTEHFGEHVLTEGNIVMFVNDNLESICSLVQKAAETASVGEVDYYTTPAVQARKNGNYIEPQVSPWAFHVPEPFKPAHGGLNTEQLAIYEDFGRTVRTNVVQTANASTQEGPRQLPDVLQDQYGAMPNVSASAENAALFRPAAQQTPSQTIQSQNRSGLLNGYGEGGGTMQERLESLHEHLLRVTIACTEEHPDQDLTNLPAVVQAWQNLKAFIQRQAGNGFMQEKIALSAAERFLMDIYNNDLNLAPATIDVLAKVLMQLCELSELTNKEVSTWIHAAEERLSSPVVTMAYIKAQLVETRFIDGMIMPALTHRNPQALTYFSEIVDSLLLSEPPVALRADFAQSMTEFSAWYKDEPTNEHLMQLSDKLQNSSSNQADLFSDQSLLDKRMQIAYVFDEWTRLQARDNSLALLPTFFVQLHKSGNLAKKEDYVLFIRVCLEQAITSFEDAAGKGPVSSEACFVKIDSLSKLVILLVSYQGRVNGAMKVDKQEYFGNILVTFIFALVKRHTGGASDAQRIFFRIFASIISEIQAPQYLDDELAKLFTIALGKSLLFVRPQAVPSFAFAFLDLLSHRLFVPAMLRPSTGDWKTYCELLLAMVPFACEQIKTFELSRPAKELFRSTIELFLVLHHDFPEFLAKHHFQLLNAIPPSCVQLRSLVISATPTSSPDMDEPFFNGLALEASGANKAVPVAREDVERVLQMAGILPTIDDWLSGSSKPGKHIEDIVDAVLHPQAKMTDLGLISVSIDIPLLHAIVLRLVLQADGNPTAQNVSFNASSPQASLLDALTEKFEPEARHFLIGAMTDQLRWPSPHTNYFGLALLHLFRVRPDDKLSQEIQMQISRVLLERLVAHRPHPWGLMVTTEELLKNSRYRFWELSFIKATPDVSTILS